MFVLKQNNNYLPFVQEKLRAAAYDLENEVEIQDWRNDAGTLDTDPQKTSSRYQLSSRAKFWMGFCPRILSSSLFWVFALSKITF